MKVGLASAAFFSLSLIVWRAGDIWSHTDRKISLSLPHSSRNEPAVYQLPVGESPQGTVKAAQERSPASESLSGVLEW